MCVFGNHYIARPPLSQLVFIYTVVMFQGCNAILYNRFYLCPQQQNAENFEGLELEPFVEMLCHVREISRMRVKLDYGKSKTQKSEITGEKWLDVVINDFYLLLQIEDNLQMYNNGISNCSLSVSTPILQMAGIKVLRIDKLQKKICPIIV